MALDVIGLGLANSYTDEEVAGGGAIKGKNAVVDDISKSGKKNTVRFKWTLDNGTVLTGNMEVLDGEDGAPGANGKDGKDGADGDPGPAGKGIASIAQVPGESKIIITYDDGTTSDPIDIPTVAGQDGKDGKDGTDGTDGTDGVSPSVAVKTSTGDTYVLTITDASGSLDTPNLKGADGQDGAPGTDGQDGQDGVGVPVGGTTGQVLKKKSGTDYDTEWANESGGGYMELTQTLEAGETEVSFNNVSQNSVLQYFTSKYGMHPIEIDFDGWVDSEVSSTEILSTDGDIASSSGSDSASVPAWHAFDGVVSQNVSNCWLSANGVHPAWLAYDFKHELYVGKVVVNLFCNNQTYNGALKVQGYYNDTEWVDLSSSVEINASQNVDKTYNIPCNHQIPVSKVRIYSENALCVYGGASVLIQEMSVYSGSYSGLKLVFEPQSEDVVIKLRIS